MPIDGKITSGAVRLVTVGTPTVSAEPEPVVDSEGLTPLERLAVAARRDKASREKVAQLAERERQIANYEAMIAGFEVTPDRVEEARQARSSEAARAFYADDLRQAIERGGDRYALLADGGEAAIQDLLQKSDEYWEITGRPVSTLQLLDAAEEAAREALQTANEGLLAVEQSPEAKKARALSAIDAALSGVRAQEQNGWALRRGAVRRGVEAERRTRTLAAIRRAQETEE